MLILSLIQVLKSTVPVVIFFLPSFAASGLNKTFKSG